MRAYDIALAALGDTPAPREFQSDTLDSLQVNCNSLLNGTPNPAGGRVSRTLVSRFLNRLLFFLIISSSIVVLAQSIPEVAREGSSGLLGLFFSAFETFTVAVFTLEYVLRLFSVTKDKQHLYSRWCYVTTFFGIVDLLAILPWYIELFLGSVSDDTAAVFRMLRLFRLFELEHFIVAFTVLDNVFARSKGVFLASGLMALVIWILSATLYYLFEKDNPNFCTEWSDDTCSQQWKPGCTCTLTAFNNVPDCLYFVAIFLAGEWVFTDFTVFGKLLCIFLCLVGIAVYAVPVGTLFDSFGAVLEDGLEALDEDEDED